MAVISAMQVFRIGAAAMAAHERAMDVVSNNIANVNTTSFGRSRVEFKEVLQAETGSNTAGVAIAGVRHLWRQGVVRSTGRALDLAIQGDGFFPVTLPDGQVGYTRDGTFQLGANGTITTADGYTLASNLTIPATAQDYYFTSDGTLRARESDSADWVEVGRLQLATFANPEGLEHIGKGVYLASEASGAARFSAPGEDISGQLVAGALEDASVDLSEEMVELITAQRLYSLGLKIVQTADEMQSLANQLLGR